MRKPLGKLREYVKQKDKLWASQASKINKKVHNATRKLESAKTECAKLCAQHKVARQAMVQAKGQLRVLQEQQQGSSESSNSSGSGDDPLASPRNRAHQASQRAQQLSKAAINADRVYMSHIRTVRGMRDESDQAIGSLLYNYEQLEHKRVRSVGIVLNHFIGVHAAMLTTLTRNVKQVSTVVAGTNPEADVQSFVRNNMSGRKPPPLPDYEQFDGHPMATDLPDTPSVSAPATATSTSAASTNTAATASSSSNSSSSDGTGVADKSKSAKRTFTASSKSNNGSQDGSAGGLLSRITLGFKAFSNAAIESIESSSILSSSSSSSSSSTASATASKDVNAAVSASASQPPAVSTKAEDHTSQEDEEKKQAAKKARVEALKTEIRRFLFGPRPSTERGSQSPAFQHIVSLFKTSEGREAFAAVLRARRNVNSGLQLRRSVFRLVGEAILKFLDHAQESMDVRPALLVMIMSQSFFHLGKSSRRRQRQMKRAMAAAAGATSADSEVSNSETSESEAEVSEVHGRVYLVQRIRGHPLWQMQRFWEEAFFDSLSVQLSENQRLEKWRSEAEQELAIKRQKNILFGQLGAFSHNMIMFNMDIETVRRFVEKMVAVHELDDEQVAALMMIVQDQYQQQRQLELQAAKEQDEDDEDDDDEDDDEEDAFEADAEESTEVSEQEEKQEQEHEQGHGHEHEPDDSEAKTVPTSIDDEYFEADGSDTTTGSAATRDHDIIVFSDSC
eukprot:TRINITY_DN66371_c15_g1_i1.p1 TRINITY_DN66371_c15_g1~~TRINITY_DN66371_c15_g1_i1.p1  ORF type:complete len:858 (+),score=444.64 TRINITY_DN66371_c15_g1_i1:374-2575(+)